MAFTKDFRNTVWQVGDTCRVSFKAGQWQGEFNRRRGISTVTGEIQEIEKDSIYLRTQDQGRWLDIHRNQLRSIEPLRTVAGGSR